MGALDPAAQQQRIQRPSTLASGSSHQRDMFGRGRLCLNASYSRLILLSARSRRDVVIVLVQRHALSTAHSAVKTSFVVGPAAESSITTFRSVGGVALTNTRIRRSGALQTASSRHQQRGVISTSAMWHVPGCAVEKS